MPLPFFFCLFLMALILLFFTKKQKMAKFLLIVSFVFLFVASYRPFSASFVQTLERENVAMLETDTAQDLDYILLLGSSGTFDATLPITGQLSATALSRFIEALRLYQANPNATLIVSGGSFGDEKSHAQLLEELALQFAIPLNHIIRIDEAKDTDDEIAAMQKIIRGKKAALVTSATHMPRALSLFKAQGLSPIPAPAHYLAPYSKTVLPSYRKLPSSLALRHTTIAWHEYLGALQLSLKQTYQKMRYLLTLI
ncbi:hypothetical protein PCNPT3_05115 [Psychromonas sp. CNPT3]|nr:hypothetical protein PCNPT3_05115 [Psychromonas sp. CNPT3]